MAGPYIFMFVKFLTEEAHAGEFLDGTLCARRISWFRKVEEGNSSGRIDMTEGTLFRDLSEGGQFTIFEQDNPDNHTIITSKDLAGPIEFQPNFLNNLNALCLHAVHTGDFDPDDTSDGRQDRLREALLIDEKCFDLGDHAVVIMDVQEFMRRIEFAVTAEGFQAWGWLVRYDGPAEFDKNFMDIKNVFRKHPDFSHQREFRFVSTPERPETPR